MSIRVDVRTSPTPAPLPADKKTPPRDDDSHYDFNGKVSDTPEFRTRLQADGYLDDYRKVPYKRNRMVMCVAQPLPSPVRASTKVYECSSVHDRFNSDLLHETDSGNFKEGYDNRRINLTFLFGVNRRTGGIEPSQSSLF